MTEFNLAVIRRLRDVVDEYRPFKNLNRFQWDAAQSVFDRFEQEGASGLVADDFANLYIAFGDTAISNTIINGISDNAKAVQFLKDSVCTARWAFEHSPEAAAPYQNGNRTPAALQHYANNAEAFVELARQEKFRS